MDFTFKYSKSIIYVGGRRDTWRIYNCFPFYRHRPLPSNKGPQKQRGGCLHNAGLISSPAATDAHNCERKPWLILYNIMYIFALEFYIFLLYSRLKIPIAVLWQDSLYEKLYSHIIIVPFLIN